MVGHKQCFISSYDDAKERSLSAKILIMTNNADKIIHDAHIELADHQFSIIKGSPFPFFVEFLVNGITKGHGLSQLCSLLGISLDHVVAFGDGDNDAEMLELAGHGIAMKNAKDKAKTKSNLVLEVYSKFACIVFSLNVVYEVDKRRRWCCSKTRRDVGTKFIFNTLKRKQKLYAKVF